MNREKVEFSPNIPTIVELDGFGTLQPSTNGADEYRYFLKGDKIMWVPPVVHEAIAATNAGKGDAFRITKHQAKARAPITWEASPVTHQPGNGYSTENYDRQPGQGWTKREAPQQPPTARRPMQTAPAAPPARAPQPAAQLAADAPELPTTPADRMAAAMKDAIDLWRGAANYAPEIKWDAGDVRALAATLFIDGSKGARQ